MVLSPIPHQPQTQRGPSRPGDVTPPLKTAWALGFSDSLEEGPWSRCPFDPDKNRSSISYSRILKELPSAV